MMLLKISTKNWTILIRLSKRRRRKPRVVSHPGSAGRNNGNFPTRHETNYCIYLANCASVFPFCCRYLAWRVFCSMALHSLLLNPSLHGGIEGTFPSNSPFNLCRLRGVRLHFWYLLVDFCMGKTRKVRIHVWQCTLT